MPTRQYYPDKPKARSPTYKDRAIDQGNFLATTATVIAEALVAPVEPGVESPRETIRVTSVEVTAVLAMVEPATPVLSATLLASRAHPVFSTIREALAEAPLVLPRSAIGEHGAACGNVRHRNDRSRRSSWNNQQRDCRDTGH
jgi:hypothetical protein